MLLPGNSGEAACQTIIRQCLGRADCAGALSFICTTCITACLPLIQDSCGRAIAQGDVQGTSGTAATLLDNHLFAIAWDPLQAPLLGSITQHVNFAKDEALVMSIKVSVAALSSQELILHPILVTSSFTGSGNAKPCTAQACIPCLKMSAMLAKGLRSRISCHVRQCMSKLPYFPPECLTQSAGSRCGCHW